MNTENLPFSSDDSSSIAWNRALIRSGFHFEMSGENLDFHLENQGNQQFLISILQELGEEKYFANSIFSPPSSVVNEKSWLGIIEEKHTGSEGGPSNMKGIQLEIMDTYMAGIVRWINAAGFETHFSCDGHKTREPRLVLANPDYESLLNFCFRAISKGDWRFSSNRLFKRGSPPPREVAASQSYDRAWLLNVAETIYRRQDLIREVVQSAEKLIGSASHSASNSHP